MAISVNKSVVIIFIFLPNVLVGDTVALDFGQCLGLSGFAGF